MPISNDYLVRQEADPLEINYQLIVPQLDTIRGISA